MNTLAKPMISVLLCSYNRAEKLNRCLSALAQQTIPADHYEIICVNDASTDSTRDIMLSALRKLPGLYVEHAKNRSLAAARNSALRAARGDLLFFINDDTYPEADCLEQHARAHRAAGRPIAVLGFVPFLGTLAQRAFSRALMDHGLYFPFSEMRQGVAYNFGYFITGNLSVPREVFSSDSSLFDEDFLRYGYEDIECGYRLWKNGLRVFYNPDAVCQHDHLVTIAQYRKRAYDNGTNILQVVAKHPELSAPLLGAEQLDEAKLAGWREFVETAESHVTGLVSELEKFEDVEIDDEKASSAEGMELIKQIAEGTRLIREFDQTKCFLEALRQYPVLSEKLLGRSKPI